MTPQIGLNTYTFLWNAVNAGHNGDIIGVVVFPHLPHSLSLIFLLHIHLLFHPHTFSLWFSTSILALALQSSSYPSNAYILHSVPIASKTWPFTFSPVSTPTLGFHHLPWLPEPQLLYTLLYSSSIFSPYTIFHLKPSGSFFTCHFIFPSTPSSLP